MSYIYITIFLAILLSIYFVLLGLRKTKEFKEKKETDFIDIHKKSVCKKIESCWCSEYSLDEDKKERILTELGEHNCGKTVGSIINNE